MRVGLVIVDEFGGENREVGVSDNDPRAVYTHSGVVVVTGPALGTDNDVPRPRTGRDRVGYNLGSRHQPGTAKAGGGPATPTVVQLVDGQVADCVALVRYTPMDGRMGHKWVRTPVCPFWLLDCLKIGYVSDSSRALCAAAFLTTATAVLLYAVLVGIAAAVALHHPDRLRRADARKVLDRLLLCR